MKNILCKLKNFKNLRIAFALSLAFVIALGCIGTLKASANETVPDFSEIVGDNDYVVLRLDSESSREMFADMGPLCFGKYHLLVFTNKSATGHKIVLDKDVRSDTLFLLNAINYDYIDEQWINTSDRLGYYYSSSLEWESHTCLTKSSDAWCYGHNDFAYKVVEHSPNVTVVLQELDGSQTVISRDTAPRGNASEEEWNSFLTDTVDFIGYHYVSNNSINAVNDTIWNEIRFNQDVYPYWDIDSAGVKRLMVYAPYTHTDYIMKDYGRYVEDGVFDYYRVTISNTDEWCIQPYAWYTDYQPDTSVPDKVFEVIVLPYIKEGWGADANAQRTLIEVYDTKADAISAYQADEGIVDSPEITPTIPPQPSPEPLPPTDDSESMGFVEFLKQFENLFNASGNMWRIMYYCWSFLPQQILWLVTSTINIFLAVMVIKWVRS